VDRPSPRPTARASRRRSRWSASSRRGLEAGHAGAVGLLGSGLLDLELHDAARHLVELGGHRVDLGADHRAGLVHEVDGLVGQEAVGDVAVERVAAATRAVSWMRTPWCTSKRSRSPRRIETVSSTWADRRDGLEAPLEGGVLLDVLAVLVEGGRADAAQLAAGEHGLEHVAGVHGALGLAGADDRVQLVDEQEDAPVGSS
jgi:hypothetical protein